MIIDFQHSRVADQSTLEAIDTLAKRYVAAGKCLHLRHLSQDCKALLLKHVIWLKFTLLKICTTK